MAIEGMTDKDRLEFEAGLADAPADDPVEWDEDALGWEAVSTLASLGGGLTAG